MRKLKIDPATQQRPTSRKQNRNAKIKEQLTQQVAVQIIPAKADMEGYEKPKPRVCAYCRVSTDMDTQALSYELQVQNYTESTTCSWTTKAMSPLRSTASQRPLLPSLRWQALGCLCPLYLC